MEKYKLIDGEISVITTEEAHLYSDEIAMASGIEINLSNDEVSRINEESVESKVAADITKSKIDRARDVAQIIVKTSSGSEFDGDELAQTRMARAITVLGSNTIQWKLADNTFKEVDAAELTEALFLAGQTQAEIWIQYG